MHRLQTRCNSLLLGETGLLWNRGENIESSRVLLCLIDNVGKCRFARSGLTASSVSPCSFQNLVTRSSKNNSLLPPFSLVTFDIYMHDSVPWQLKRRVEPRNMEGAGPTPKPHHSNAPCVQDASRGAAYNNFGLCRSCSPRHLRLRHFQSTRREEKTAAASEIPLVGIARNSSPAAGPLWLTRLDLGNKVVHLTTHSD